MVQSQLASSPDAGVLLGDEALDGSGSGDSAVWRQHSEIDDDEDGHGGDDDDEASGSGMGPTTTGTVSWQPTVMRLINRRYNSARYIVETKFDRRMVSICSIEYRFVYVCIRNSFSEDTRVIPLSIIMRQCV